MTRIDKNGSQQSRTRRTARSSGYGRRNIEKTALTMGSIVIANLLAPAARAQSIMDVTTALHAPDGAVMLLKASAPYACPPHVSLPRCAEALETLNADAAQLLAQDCNFATANILDAADATAGALTIGANAYTLNLYGPTQSPLSSDTTCAVNALSGSHLFDSFKNNAGSETWSAGAVAGLAIGTAAAGAVTGGVLVHLLGKHSARRTSAEMALTPAV